MSRLLDPGAIFAGWVGLGTAVVIVVAFGLVLPIQPLVFVSALPAGAVIGWYANERARRRRPRTRVLANALWASLVTALAMATFYVGVRLVFIYGDTGYPDFNRVDRVTGERIPPFCESGPDCTYRRYLADRRAELEAAGVTDAESFARYIVAEQVSGGGLLFGLTLAGGAGAGAVLAARPRLDVDDRAG
ncbi:MAG: hypothetical protein M3N29_04010 [Chloroflexota bacterium]|nr:hypothetical protein [Chloroflexota bacterium]